MQWTRLKLNIKKKLFPSKTKSSSNDILISEYSYNSQKGFGENKTMQNFDDLNNVGCKTINQISKEDQEKVGFK